ncbi:MAG: hypothetical protein AAF698_09810 [Pseudomonadota bacterium]
MAKRFAGTHRHKVEERGRVSLPSAFRKVLASLDTNEVYVLPQLERADAHLCLTGPGFDAYCAKVEAAIDDPAELKAFTRYFNSRATILEPDDLGRIVLSKELREPLGIAKELVFVGLGFSFEICAPDRQAADREAAETLARPVLDRVPMTGLH